MGPPMMCFSFILSFFYLFFGELNVSVICVTRFPSNQNEISCFGDMSFNAQGPLELLMHPWSHHLDLYQVELGKAEIWTHYIIFFFTLWVFPVILIEHKNCIF